MKFRSWSSPFRSRKRANTCRSFCATRKFIAPSTAPARQGRRFRRAAAAEFSPREQRFGLLQNAPQTVPCICRTNWPRAVSGMWPANWARKWYLLQRAALQNKAHSDVLERVGYCFRRAMDLTLRLKRAETFHFDAVLRRHRAVKLHRISSRFIVRVWTSVCIDSMCDGFGRT